MMARREPLRLAHSPRKIRRAQAIDNDGNYEPGNCRWATPKEQAANRRRLQPREGLLQESWAA